MPKTRNHSVFEVVSQIKFLLSALTDIILNQEDSAKNNISEEDENYFDVSDIKLNTPAQQQREKFKK